MSKYTWLPSKVTLEGPKKLVFSLAFFVFFVLLGLGMSFQKLSAKTSLNAVTTGPVEVSMEATPIVQCTAGSLAGQFAVNAVGAGTYRVPLTIPPGSAGMQPSLSLEYGSQFGNGQLGVGWRVGGLSTITRCPATVAPRYVKPLGPNRAASSSATMPSTYSYPKVYFKPAIR
jgi:hypothetical protein